MYQEVMRNPNITAEAKAIYAYLSSIAGTGNTCYPSIDTMQREMCMSKNRLMKHMSQLIATGVVKKVRERNGNIYGRNIYKITHEAEVIEDLNCIFENCDFRAVENEAVEIRAVENEADNNNIIIKEHKTKNREEYQQVVDLYNSVCVSFPRLTRLSDKRKKTIRARFNQGYNLDDFKKVFELAEGSRFLKGGNNRNWHATFDWMIADANMVKILDGNYVDRNGDEGDEATTGKSGRSARGFYEQYLRACDSN